MISNADILSKYKITKNWTLFLDRDGTINKLLVDDYVKSWEEFQFIEGALEAIPILNKIFDLTLIVTNQQGVGKNLMTEKALRTIHVQMLEEITLNGGYIDEIYYCPNLEKELSEYRKPNTGMGIQALSDFPKINFSKSIMVGDALTDMQFGKNLGMKTVLLSKDHAKLKSELTPLIDIKTTDLASFAQEILESIVKDKFH